MGKPSQANAKVLVNLCISWLHAMQEARENLTLTVKVLLLNSTAKKAAFKGKRKGRGKSVFDNEREGFFYSKGCQKMFKSQRHAWPKQLKF